MQQLSVCIAMSLLFLVFAERKSGSALDVREMAELSSAIVSEIVGKPVRLHVRTSVIVSGISKNDYFFELKPATAKKITKYLFDAGTKNANHSFWVVIADYPDGNRAEAAFAALKRQSGKPDGSGDKLPGLTYSNDYVVKSGNSIVWLNSGCLYSVENQKKLVGNLKEVLNFGMVETIRCECGAAVCE